MTQTSRSKLIINEYEYEVLTDTWKGPAGAAYNACWEYCQENGLIKGNGQLTFEGEDQVKLYSSLNVEIIRKDSPDIVPNTDGEPLGV
jgi:hypothetical protein